MVAAEGRPAERGFGKVARAHVEQAFGVGDGEQDLRAFTRLCVFKYDAVVAFRVPDIRKVLPAGGNDADLPVFAAKGAHEELRVVFRAARCAEPRHGNAHDACARQLEPVRRGGGGKKSQRAVQPAGNADHKAAAVDVRKPPAKSGGLQIQQAGEFL